MHLARLEIESLLRAMAPRVARFMVGEPVVGMNNTIYGFASMPMRLVPGGPVGTVVSTPAGCSQIGLQAGDMVHGEPAASAATTADLA